MACKLYSVKDKAEWGCMILNMIDSVMAPETSLICNQGNFYGWTVVKIVRLWQLWKSTADFSKYFSQKESFEAQ